MPPDPEEAKRSFEKSLEHRPDYGFAHYELGNLALEAAMEGGAAPPTGSKDLATAAEQFAKAVNLSPSSLLFVNNLGVALINQGKAEEAILHFQKVLELHHSGASFAAIKGLDPEAGAHLNLGHALRQLSKHAEAHTHWLTALNVGSYEHAVQAVQRLVADDASSKLPHAAVLDLIFGRALEKEGRIREASLRYAAAHVGSANMTAADEEAAGVAIGAGTSLTASAIVATVADRMLALSEVWDEGEGALAEQRAGGGGGGSGGGAGSGGGGGGGGSKKVHMVQAAADGTMKRTEMTQDEMMAALKTAQSKSAGAKKA